MNDSAAESIQNVSPVPEAAKAVFIEDTTTVSIECSATEATAVLREDG